MATADGSTVRSQDEGVSSAATGQRYLGLRLTIGILSIIVGILVIAHPVNTLLFIAILLGIQLVILGAVRIALAVSAASGGLKTAGIILGVVSIIAGLVCFIRPNASLFVIALVLALGWIADGVAEVFRAFSARTTGIDKTYALLLGVVSLAAGILVLVFPHESLVLLTQTAGVALLVIGVVSCLAALLGRRRAA